jgi:hypothetical protein
MNRNIVFVKKKHVRVQKTKFLTKRRMTDLKTKEALERKIKRSSEVETQRKKKEKLERNARVERIKKKIEIQVDYWLKDENSIQFVYNVWLEDPDEVEEAIREVCQQKSSSLVLLRKETPGCFDRWVWFVVQV